MPSHKRYKDTDERGLINKNMKNILAKNKRGVATVVWVLMIMAIAVVSIFAIAMIPQKQAEGQGTGTVDTDGKSYAASCPSDFGFSGTVNVQNDLNTSGAETFDTTMRFFEVKSDNTESFVGSITDTTSGSLTSTDCGKVFVGKIESVSGAEGDNSFIQKATMSGGEIIKVENGYVYFAVTSASGVLNAFVHQHGLPQLRAYDIENDGYLKNEGGNASTTWNATDTVNFTSTTGAETATTVGSGGSLNVRLEIQSQNVDESYIDRGMYMLVEAPATNWTEPNVFVEGSVLSNYKASLNPDETIAFTSYEYAYLVPQSYTVKSLNPSRLNIEVYLKAISGVNPDIAAGPEYDFAPIGTYTSVLDSNLVKVGAVKDDSSKTAVYTLWDTEVDIA
jgi:hypothetical protein